MRKIKTMQLLKDSFIIGLKNFPSLVLATILYIVTLWIPYLNIGTTIAMQTIQIQLAKGKVINPLFIFNGKYRKQMGNYLLICSFMFVGLLLAALFMVIPMYVLAISWSVAIPLMIDKELEPLKALHESNRLTYGYKWTIFGTYILLTLAIAVLFGIVNGIGQTFDHFHFVFLLNLIVIILIIPIRLGLDAAIYKGLCIENAHPENTNIQDIAATLESK